MDRHCPPVIVERNEHLCHLHLHSPRLYGKSRTFSCSKTWQINLVKDWSIMCIEDTDKFNRHHYTLRFYSAFLCLLLFAFFTNIPSSNMPICTEKYVSIIKDFRKECVHEYLRIMCIIINGLWSSFPKKTFYHLFLYIDCYKCAKLIFCWVKHVVSWLN